MEIRRERELRNGVIYKRIRFLQDKVGETGSQEETDYCMSWPEGMWGSEMSK